MRIKNERKFDIVLPYAGADHKGWNIKAGHMGPHVPADRFYDARLQNDWKNKKISLHFTSADLAILGSAVPSSTVATEDVKQATTAVDSPEVVKTENTELGKTMTSEPVVSDPNATTEIAPPDVPTPADPKVADDTCVRCGSKDSVNMDDRVNENICRRCKSSVTKKLKADAQLQAAAEDHSVKGFGIESKFGGVTKSKVDGLSSAPQTVGELSLAKLQELNSALKYTPTV